MNFKFLDFFRLVFGLGLVKNYLTFYVGSADSPSSSTATTNNDNRMVLGQDAQFATNGGSIVNQSLDAGMVQDAFGFGTAAMDQNASITDSAFTNFGKINTSNLNFASDAVTSALKGIADNDTRAFNFAGDTVQASLNASAASATRAANTVSDAISFVSASNARSATTQANAISTAADSMSQALAYGSKTTSAALDTLSSTETLITNAYEDAKGRGALTDKIMMAAIVGALFVAFKASSR